MFSLDHSRVLLQPIPTNDSTFVKIEGPYVSVRDLISAEELSALQLVDMWQRRNEAVESHA